MPQSSGERLIRLRWPIVAAWLAGAIVLAVAAPDVDPAANELPTLLPDGSAFLQAAEALRKHFPDSAGLSQAVVVVERRGETPRLTADDQLALADLVAKLRGPLPAPLAGLLPVDRLSVRAPGDFPPALRPNPLLSPDGAAAIAVVEVPANFVTVRSARLVAHVRRLAGGQAWPEGLAVAVTGSAAFGADYAEASRRSHRDTLWVTVTAVLVILLLVYRAPGAAGVVLATISVAAVVAHFVLKVAAGWGLHVGTAERIFVFVLLYGVGVDYSLLYLSRFRELLLPGADPGRAAAGAWAAAAPAIAASAGTDIAGLALLTAAGFKVFRTTGCVVPIALLVALAAALTLIPAVAAILHRRLFWPGSRAGPFGSDRFWPAVAGLVTRRPRLVLAVTALALLVPALGRVRIRYVYDALTGLSPNYQAVAGREMARRHWPVGQLTPVVVLVEAEGDARPARVEPVAARLTKVLEQTPGVMDVRSLTQPLGRGGRTLYTRWLLKRPAAKEKVRRAYLSPTGQATRLEVVLKAAGFSNRAMDMLAPLAELCRQNVPEGFRCRFAGATAYMDDVRRVTRGDFFRIAPLVLGVVFVLVLVLLRDALLSGFMVATTALSYLATLGIAHGVFVVLGGAPGLDWKVEVFLFVVLVAVGQDYNIFLAARLAEESRSAPPAEAARVALIKTGGIISSAGVIMAATLGSLMVGDIALLVQLGFAFTVGMLLDTFVVRPLLLPAFVVLTGRTGRPISRR